MSSNSDHKYADSKSINSFHITHNNSDYPSKFSMRTVFPFSQDDYNTQEKLKTIHMQKHGGGGANKVYYWCESAKKKSTDLPLYIRHI